MDATMIVDRLRQIVGTSWATSEQERIVDYLTDETAPGIKPQPATKVVLVKPADAREVSKILKMANGERIPCFLEVAGRDFVGALSDPGWHRIVTRETESGSYRYR